MKNSATFYLLKDEYSNVDDAFIDPINAIDVDFGKLFLRKKDVPKPNWANFIEMISKRMTSSLALFHKGLQYQ